MEVDESLVEDQGKPLFIEGGGNENETVEGENAVMKGDGNGGNGPLFQEVILPADDIIQEEEVRGGKSQMVEKVIFDELEEEEGGKNHDDEKKLYFIDHH